VTVPALKDGPQGYDAMAGYRATGERAIRIDMLERLADMLRQENSRGGFEAKADMLSITGLSLEQFAHLMEGLGYRAERGERAKVRAAPVAAPAEMAEEGMPEAVAEAPAEGTTAPDALTAESAVVDAAEPEAAAADAAAADAAEPVDAAPAEPAEMEVFYTFTWGGNRGRREQGERRGPRREGQGERPRREGQGDRPRREAGEQGQGERPQGGKPRGDRPWESKGDRGDRGGKGKGPKGKRPPREEGPRVFEARPQRKDRIDPDNPFAAALMGFRTKD
jgi:ATP-dependent RNA helicase SUPV3L1/SUV3